MNEFKNLADILNIDFSEYPDDAEIEEMERRQAECEKLELYKKQAPERYWNESVDTYRAETENEKHALQVTRDFIKAVKCGKFCSLMYIGNVGTGKTHLALGIIRECGGIYRLSPNIVEQIRRAKSFSSNRAEADILEDYGRVPVLIIDEIGRGVAAAEEQYMLYQIINERYNRRKPTVLISNQTKKDFLNYIGIAAADRLTESAQVVEFTGKSYRGELRHENAGIAARSAGA